MLKKNVLLMASGYSIILLVMSLVSLNTGANLATNSDKVFHFIAHFLFVILWFYAFKEKFLTNKNKAMLLALLFSACFGIIVEVLQDLFTTSRQADIKDVLANLLGALAGVLALRLLHRKQIKI